MSVKKKAQQRLGMIRRCFSNHSSSVIGPLYRTIVSPVWNPWLQKDINLLDKVQNRCIRLAANHLPLEPLKARRDKQDLTEIK